jgi:hypothetical protein
VKATGDDVAVPGVLIADRRIDGEYSSVQIANPEKHFPEEVLIVGEDRGHERS